MATDPKILNEILSRAGASKTVYAYVMAETEAGVDLILDGDRDAVIRDVLQQAFAHSATPDLAALAADLAAALDAAREPFRDMYRDSWTKKQDAAHREFFDAWQTWTKPVLKFDADEFPYKYPTGGASEALREAINLYGVTARSKNLEPVLHVFEGEYEGYDAYAKGNNIRVVRHDRDNWHKTISQIGPNDRFFLSQPSAIDGNVWPEFDTFIQALREIQPRAAILLDLTYVGAVARTYNITTEHPNITTLVFSLSKPIGAYYHRIGALISRDEHPGLYGNMWFKNLFALRLGTTMMQRHDVYDLPQRYCAAQLEAATKVGKNLGMEVTASDVYLLGTAPVPAEPTDLEKYLSRSVGRAARARLCLSPTIDQIVTARAAKADVSEALRTGTSAAGSKPTPT